MTANNQQEFNLFNQQNGQKGNSDIRATPDLPDMHKSPLSSATWSNSPNIQKSSTLDYNTIDSNVQSTHILEQLVYLNKLGMECLSQG